uniref:Acyl-CoA oxidase n=1 Tax=Timema tahoe TaxID=61484 RepID=A0A7R9IFR4_9NEOP|nr:unnamed protein product [Timema tahoe]
MALSLDREEHSSHYTAVTGQGGTEFTLHCCHWTRRNTVHTTLLSLDREEHSSHYTAVTGHRGTQFTLHYCHWTQRNTVHTTLRSLDREEQAHTTLLSLDREEHSSHYTDATGQKLTLITCCLLFPYIAAAFALKVYSEYSLKILVEFNIALMLNKRSDHMNNLGAEIHALQSSAKPLCSWTAQHGIQECREACGGHGYLSLPTAKIFHLLRRLPHFAGSSSVDSGSGFGKLRDDNDANCTYEGDNNVLCQQTSNWLLQIWSQARDTRVGDISPLGSIGFLQRATVGELLARRFTAQTLEQAAHPEGEGVGEGEDVKAIHEVLSAYGWLVTWLLEGTHALHQVQLREGKGPFVARNSSQVFHARTLSLAYIETHFVGRGYAVGPAMSRFVKRGILNLCSELKSESVALVDVLAPPDFILNSALGHSDGQVYKNLQLHMYQSPGVMSRPSWWKEMSGLHRSRL